MIKTLDKRLTDLLMSAAGTYEIRLLAGEARDEIRLTTDRIATLESEVVALRAEVEGLWSRCHIIYWPQDTPRAYPLEHNPAAKKDARYMIEAAMRDDAARKESSK